MYSTSDPGVLCMASVLAGVGVCAVVRCCSAPVRVLCVCRPVRVRPPPAVSLNSTRTWYRYEYMYRIRIDTLLRKVLYGTGTRYDTYTSNIPRGLYKQGISA